MLLGATPISISSLPASASLANSEVTFLAKKVTGGRQQAGLKPDRFLSLPFDLTGLGAVEKAGLSEDAKQCWPKMGSWWSDHREATCSVPDQIAYAGKACSKCFVVFEFDRQLRVCQGGVFDYFEFVRPAGEPLSREQFHALMESDDAPQPPAWAKSYRSNPSTGGADSSKQQR